MRLVVLATFLSLTSFLPSSNAEEKHGPVECYLYAKYHTNLDEKGMGELCSMAADNTPAKCFERATQHGTAPSSTAITLCKRQILEVIRH